MSIVVCFYTFTISGRDEHPSETRHHIILCIIQKLKELCINNVKADISEDSGLPPVCVCGL